MNNWLRMSACRVVMLGVAFACASIPRVSVYAQPQVNTSVPNELNLTLRSTVTGSLSPRLRTVTDLGRASSQAVVQGIMLHLRSTESTQARLVELIEEQQSSGSESYHKWITPDQYARQFGQSPHDTKLLEAWLSSVGFSRIAINRSRTAISFDGDVSTIEEAFGTEVHVYDTGHQKVLSPAANITLPVALSKLVDGVAHIGEFPLHSNLKIGPAQAPQPFLSSQTATHHYISPADIQNIYDFQPLYASGNTGREQSIAVVGQSAIHLGDVSRFRRASNQENMPLNVVLVPGTGQEIFRPGDELESDIDLEYAGAIAPDAQLYFVFTGSASNHNAFDALAYAVDNNIASVISVSYGVCERDLSSSELALYEQVLMQAAAQGQTVVVASGDLGSTGCDVAQTGTTEPAVAGLAVQYPASSAYVTTVGGTMLEDSGDSQYWGSRNISGTGEALSYIPERGWNESGMLTGRMLLGSGGGASERFAKPTWQKGPGVPADGLRDIPDLAMDAGLVHYGYVYCSSDSFASMGTCSSGFSALPGGEPGTAGGTSFGAPIIAGLVALINQANDGARAGLINSSLYRSAAAAPDALHDIVNGDNKQPCTPDSRDCPSGGPIGYVTGPGYDQVTGLGTPDAAQMSATIVAGLKAELIPVILTVTAPVVQLSRLQPTLILTTASSSAGTPTGTVELRIDQTAILSLVLDEYGTASYSFSSAEVGPHTISALYSGDYSHAAARADIVLQVADMPHVAGNPFTLNVQPLPAATMSSAAALVKVASLVPYTGRIVFAATVSDDNLWQNGCYILHDAQVRETQEGISYLTIGRTTGQCEYLRSLNPGSTRKFEKATSSRVGSRASTNNPLNTKINAQPGLAIRLGALCSLVFMGCGRKRRLHFVTILACIALAVSCSGCLVVTTWPQAAPGEYDVVITGTAVSGIASTSSVTAHLMLN